MKNMDCFSQMGVMSHSVPAYEEGINFLHIRLRKNLRTDRIKAGYLLQPTKAMSGRPPIYHITETKS